jgi:hypothetical protein
MVYEVDQMIADAVESVVPWKLAIKVGDVVYEIPPLRVVDLAKLEGIETLSTAEALDRVGSFFGDPKPNLAEWSANQLTAAVSVMLNYFKEHASKNSTIIAEKVAAAMKPKTAN